MMMERKRAEGKERAPARLCRDQGLQKVLLAALCLALALRGLHFFQLYGSTAFEWPALDMALYFERAADSHFLMGDFFTDASAAPNPRHVFGGAVLLAGRVMGWHWYQTLFALKLLCALAFPPLLLLVAWKFSLRRLPQGCGRVAALAVIAAGVVLLVSTRLPQYLSVAWFSPYKVDATPQSLSLLLGLTGAVFLAEERPLPFGSGLVLLAAATLIHPAIGLFIAALVVMARSGRGQWRALLLVAGTALAAAAAISLIYAPGVGISAARFVRYYVVERHPSHYLPSAFGSLTSWPWYRSFTVVVLCLTLPVAYFARRRDWSRLLMPGLFLTAYIGSLLAQWLLVEIYPVKQVAALGPIRFTVFGYLMVLTGWALAAGDVVDALTGQMAGEDGAAQATPALWPMTGGVLAVCLAAAAFLAPQLRDDPAQRVMEDYGPLLKWIASTPEGSTLAVYQGQLNLIIPLFTRRPVYASNGFPFREDFFAQYADRYSRLYGSAQERKGMPGSWSGARSANFYRSLQPRDFLEAARAHRLDYVILEKGRTRAFEHLVPVYRDKASVVYSLEAMAGAS